MTSVDLISAVTGMPVFSAQGVERICLCKVHDRLRHDPPEDTKAAARIDAVRSLGEIGPAAEAALPMLRRAVTTRTLQIWTGSLAAVVEDDAWVQACARALTEIDAYG